MPEITSSRWAWILFAVSYSGLIASAFLYLYAIVHTLNGSHSLQIHDGNPLAVSVSGLIGSIGVPFFLIMCHEILDRYQE